MPTSKDERNMRDVNLRNFASASLTWYQADIVFGERHGCMPIQKRLPYKWPLALDVFKRQYDALVAGNVLDFQAEYFDKTKVGQTFEVKLLGRIGYFTTDPKNLEAILSTNFEGKMLPRDRLSVIDEMLTP